MSTPTIDYDALARQHGGTPVIDYDALAAQHGGTPVAVAPPTPPQPQQEGFWESLGHTFGIGEQEAQAKQQELQAHPVASVLKGVFPGASMVQGAYQGAKRIGSELAQIPAAMAAGNTAEAGVHAVQALPFVGPAIQHGAEQLQSGQSMNPAEVGTALGTAMQAAPMALGAVDEALPGRATIPNPPVANAIRSGANNLATKLYESALKPSTTLSPAERSGMVNTGLKNELPVSAGGLQKLSSLVEDLNDKIKATIAADPTRPIDPNAVATRIDALKPRIAQQVNASEDLSQIEAIKRQFLLEQGEQPGAPATLPRPTGLLDARGNPILTAGSPSVPPKAAPMMSASDAQAMKQGTYRSLGGKSYGELKGASIEAQKALAKGLKEEIANQFPGIDDLNSDESRLLDLQPSLERAVNRAANQQLLGMGAPVAGGAAGIVTGSPVAGAVVGIMKAAFDDPVFKSRLAIRLSKTANIPPSAAIMRINQYAANLSAAHAATSGNGQDDQTSLSQPHN